MSHEALRVAKFGATIWHTLKIRKPEMKGFNTNKISSSPYSFLSTDSKVNKQKCSKLSRKFNATCYIFCCNFLLSHALIKITVKRTLSSQTMTWVLDQNQAAEMKLMGTEFSWPKIINISRVAQNHKMLIIMSPHFKPISTNITMSLAYKLYPKCQSTTSSNAVLLLDSM